MLPQKCNQMAKFADEEVSRRDAAEIQTKKIIQESEKKDQAHNENVQKLQKSVQEA